MYLCSCYPRSLAGSWPSARTAPRSSRAEPLASATRSLAPQQRIESDKSRSASWLPKLASGSTPGGATGGFTATVQLKLTPRPVARWMGRGGLDRRSSPRSPPGSAPKQARQTEALLVIGVARTARGGHCHRGAGATSGLSFISRRARTISSPRRTTRPAGALRSGPGRRKKMSRPDRATSGQPWAGINVTQREKRTAAVPSAALLFFVPRRNATTLFDLITTGRRLRRILGLNPSR